MKYCVERNRAYDFLHQSYATAYPNLHKYPATMLPQIGIKIMNDFAATRGQLLDPYCGSGSSFASGLEYGMSKMDGFDINPLAVLITKVKFTKIDTDTIIREREKLKSAIEEHQTCHSINMPQPQVTNINYWFSEKSVRNLNIIRHAIYQIQNTHLRNIFLVSFSDTVRRCSYTRKNEFKLYKMDKEQLDHFDPDVTETYFHTLDNIISIYLHTYLPKLSDNTEVHIQCSDFTPKNSYYDTVLTSPPYGDSRTTVAYGQFSTLSNEWMGIKNARKIDGMLMGGKRSIHPYFHGVIADYVRQIWKENSKRGLEVSAFYEDLAYSIMRIAKSVKPGGKVFYIVGNRTVKNIQLPTDQFVADQFEQNNFRHIITFKRAISNKAMPSRNSPSNIAGKTSKTMLYEYIVACVKNHQAHLSLATSEVRS